MTNDSGNVARNQAERRVSFKYHVLIYFIINILFWTMWYISLKNVPAAKTRINSIPWPVWPMVGWGILLFLHYLAVYRTKKRQKE